MIKKHYEIPESELLLVKFEENFCGTTSDPKGGIPDFTSDDVDDDSNFWGGNN